MTSLAVIFYKLRLRNFSYLNWPLIAQSKFSLGPDTGFDLLSLVEQGDRCVVRVQRNALAWSHYYIPGKVGFGIGLFLNSLVFRIPNATTS